MDYGVFEFFAKQLYQDISVAFLGEAPAAQCLARKFVERRHQFFVGQHVFFVELETFLPPVFFDSVWIVPLAFFQSPSASAARAGNVEAAPLNNLSLAAS